MVIYNNSWITVTKDDPSFYSLYNNLIYTRTVKKRSKQRGSNKLKVSYAEERLPLYELLESAIAIPIGLLPMIKDYFFKSEITDNRSKSNLSDTHDLVFNIEDYKNILSDDITLREVQVEALAKILLAKRCIIQITTGGGKSEIMCALVKILAETNDNKFPTTIVFEPTLRLVNDMVARFEGYDIPVVKYGDNREIVPNTVNICQPISLGNDLDKNPYILDEVQIMIGDECHHYSSDSFRKPTYYVNNLEYSIGLSASSIDQANVSNMTMNGYSYEELLMIGATGPIALNVVAKDLIDDEILAIPVLCVLNNPADEYLAEEDIANWHKTTAVRLESDNRTRLAAMAAELFHNNNRKTLILVHTIRWARKFLEIFHEYELSDYVRASYGGDSFESYNGHEYVRIKDEDVFDKFKSGEYTILVATTHLYEGADVPNLDAIILAYGGKKQRLQIQGIGRVLRKTKQGKYAWIIDFTDHNDPILKRHSQIRLKRYQEQIGITNDRVYYGLPISSLDEIFNRLENDK